MRGEPERELLGSARRAERALQDARRVLRTRPPTMPECWALLDSLGSTVRQLPRVLDEVVLAADAHARRVQDVGELRAALRQAMDSCHRLSIELEAASAHLADAPV